MLDFLSVRYFSFFSIQHNPDDDDNVEERDERVRKNKL